MIAVNRSAGEDSGSRISEQQVEGLFDGLVVEQISGTAGHTRSLVEEAWRAFLMIMLAAMIGEACLCLPKAKSHQALNPAGGAQNRGQPATERVGSNVA